jgi:ABC-2 type transport system ATP-binding protein
MPSPAINAQGLRRTFGELVAVDGLDLQVNEGEIFGLVGPDGAGKTTTMRMLTGILAPTAGSAAVAGHDVVCDSEGLKNHIGYMSQRFGLYPDLTVIENINFYADIYSVPLHERTARTERLLGFSNLAPFKHRQAGNLSGGMKQKLGLACALIHTPRVLFLDEPTNGVDPVSRRDFWRILYQLVRDGVTLFVSTAYLDEAERCNRLALLHQGRLVGLGTPDEVKRLMPGTLLEVRTSAPRRTALLLRTHLHKASVGLFGDRVHVVTRDAATTEVDTRRLVTGAGFELLSLHPVEPSLEDVFVSVIAPEKTTGEPGPNPEKCHVLSDTSFHALGIASKPEGADAAAEPIVEVQNLEKRFGEFRAVAGISFSVARGEIFGFLGPNGAGKSTTIRMLCGLLTPSGGTGRVAGFDIRTQAELIKTRIGYMSQKFSLYDELTVEENIDFYSGIYRLPTAKKAARKDWVLRMAGLTEHRHSRTGVLSGGWKQRLALGCAVLHEPPILFLDEPTSGVDPNSRRQFWDLIYELAGQGVTVFVTTHYMEESEYCDRLGIVYRGELIALGRPRDLKTRHMTDAVLEIDCEQPNDAMTLLERVPSVKETALFGKGLHAVAADAEVATAAIRAALAAGNIGVTRVERILPTLEDVFVSLIEARDRAAGAQKEFNR